MKKTNRSFGKGKSEIFNFEFIELYSNGKERNEEGYFSDLQTRHDLNLLELFQVLVCTHELELTRALNKTYELYHFQGTIKDDMVDFDYKLKSGSVKTTNALKILKMSDYPRSIIEAATSELKNNKKGP